MTMRYWNLLNYTGMNNLNTYQTATLIKNNDTYFFTCNTDSNPCVNLTMYDTDSMMTLSNYSYYYYDWINNKCSNSAYFSILFNDDDSKFDNLKSITCAASSLNPRVNLTSSIVGNVFVVKLISKNFMS
jgi:hypothetical protein